MKKQDKSLKGVPTRGDLINPTLKALQILGGSGKNDEICDEVIKLLELPDKVTDIPHGSGSRSELGYRLAWVRTYLKKYGVIDNSARAVWSINSDHIGTEALDTNMVIKAARGQQRNSESVASQISGYVPEVNESDLPMKLNPGVRSFMKY